MTKKSRVLILSMILLPIIFTMGCGTLNKFQTQDEHGLVEIDKDEVRNYYTSIFPELDGAFENNEVKVINISRSIGNTDTNFYIDNIWYDLDGEKILVMYHIDRFYDNREVKSTIRIPLNDDFESKGSTRTTSLDGKLKYLGQGAKAGENFYGLLGYDVLRDDEKVLSPEKIEMIFDIKLNYQNYKLYDIIVDL